MINGYYNEFDFINNLNNKFVFQLENRFIVFLKKLYDFSINSNDYVKCYKTFKTDKADLVIVINNIKKYVSIKSGKNNSVHLETISDFITFLKENSISEDVIEIYKDYHYAHDQNENRLSAKEYQENNQRVIEKFNNAINQKEILLKAIDRFLFKGIYYYNHDVDMFVYGNVKNFSYLTKKQIVNFLINNNEKFNSIHFSLLVLQPWTRNLNNNPKYEYRRHYVQVKWYRLEEIIEKIIKF